VLPLGGAAAALGISYRPAIDEDLPLLALVYASTRTEELALTGWPDELKQQFLAHQFDAQHVEYRRRFPAAEWLVIEHEGVGIGRLYIDEDDKRFHIIDIALLPAARGSGFGGAILADIQSQAALSGKPVVIHVENFNPARQLYDRLGFIRIETDNAVYDLMEWRPGRTSS
jgi:ribosomal protein S18 acetylase RimI-like enzyme